MSRRKPVFNVDDKTMWNYKFNAMRHTVNGVELLASNSLRNLKSEVKKRGWWVAWLQCKNGSFSYGQNVVDSYPYKPRYR